MRPGKSIETAIKILAHDGGAGVEAEYRLIEALFGRRNQGWEFSGQRLLLHGDRHYDEVRFLTPDDKEHVIYFEIESFLPRRRPFGQPTMFNLPDDGTVFVVALS